MNHSDNLAPRWNSRKILVILAALIGFGALAGVSYWATDNPRGRLRLNGMVYPVTITRVTDPAELGKAWQARVTKLQAVGGTDNPAPPVNAEREERWWTFRIRSVG
jgi:hypothetical protein